MAKAKNPEVTPAVPEAPAPVASVAPEVTPPAEPAAEPEVTPAVPAVGAKPVHPKTYPVVTREGSVVVTEFADGTIHRNAVGASK